MLRPSKFSSKKYQQDEQLEQNWRHLIGYDTARSTLIKAISTDKLSPVLLFSGREGIGKSRFLLAVAAIYFCLSRSACGKCIQCKKVALGEHPDLLMIKPEDGKIKIEKAAEAQAHLDFKPRKQDPRSLARRIVCIADIDALTPQATNRLLKTLEEPPEDTSVLMSTSRKNIILPTMLSRSLIWPIQPPPLEKTFHLLKETLQNKGISLPSDEHLHTVISKKGLATGKILSMFEDNSENSDNDLEDLRKLILGKPHLNISDLAENLIKKSGWKLRDLIIECEYILNQEYRLNNQSQYSTVTINRRRALLRKLHELCIKQKININSQLALEHLAFLNNINQ